MSSQRSRKAASEALQAILCSDSEDGYISSSGDCSDFDADYNVNAPEEQVSDDSDWEYSTNTFSLSSEKFYGNSSLSSVCSPPSQPSTSAVATTPLPQKRRKVAVGSTSGSSASTSAAASQEQMCKTPPVANSTPSTFGRNEAIPSTIIKASTSWTINNDNDYVHNEPVFTGKRQVNLANTETPVNIFKHFFDNDLLDDIVYNTNLYASQVNINSAFNLTRGELMVFLGINIVITYIRYPRLRMYWSSNQGTRCGLIADAMSVNRFEAIRRHLHFVDNEKHDANSTDKVWKLRPVMEALRKRFLTSVDAEECHSIDEQMVPFTGQSGLKQYIKSKPKKWGYKIWVRSGVSGYVYDFELYQGASGNRPEKVLGLSPDVVMRLSDRLAGKNHKVYFDNLFTTLELLTELKKKKIYAVGTLRKNRLCGADEVLICDKGMRTRGSATYATNKDNITIVKWNDNNFVYTASTFVGMQPTSVVQRWDKKAKKHVDVIRPRAIEVYNKHMGGVDLTDFLISCYRHSLKHKRWYLRLFFHFVNVTIVNGWLIHRWEHGDSVDLLEFRSSVAQALITQGWTMSNQRKGRPSSSYVHPPCLTNIRTRVPDEIRYNLDAGHWPEKSAMKYASRCVAPTCHSKTRYLCRICKKALCPECFGAYHTK
ncbi:piggyBac transposable element-derived protein 3-like [Watersipora subatra]|uniref:piggyBac transposable element-derived protein 3-like n=1 Tax=Watersipora subatra TaxID=2589382 RepID=UPI00355C7A41